MENKNELNIIEVSACGNRQAEKKLKYQGNMNDRINTLIKKVLQKGTWHLISVRDIPYRSLNLLEEELKFYGYKMIMHKSFKDVKEKWRYTCLSALFVIDTVEFEQMYTSDKFETVLRYVFGRINIGGEFIYYKTSHFPCVDKSLRHHIERKVKMLEDENEFQRLMDEALEFAISAGDFNGEPSGDFCGQEEFDKFRFVDKVLSDTYQNKRLDHCYISKALNDSHIKIKVEALDDYYMVLTDHRLISIKLKSA